MFSGRLAGLGSWEKGGLTRRHEGTKVQGALQWLASSHFVALWLRAMFDEVVSPRGTKGREARDACTLRTSFVAWCPRVRLLPTATALDVARALPATTWTPFTAAYPPTMSRNRLRGRLRVLASWRDRSGLVLAPLPGCVS